MRFERDASNPHKWWLFLTPTEHAQMVGFMKLSYSPAVENITHVTLVAGPYNHTSQFLQVQVDGEDPVADDGSATSSTVG